ncbi:MAG: membrane protein insertase YidC [Bacteroidota bacterium]|nr:membrane protein insertase YidC [Bacteroidota bacterium]
MDKNTLTGFVLIFLIVIGFYWLNKPSDRQRAAMIEQQRIKDSLALVESAKPLPSDSLAAKAAVDTTKSDTATSSNKYGIFASLTTAKPTYATLENDVMKLTLSSKGGRIVSVQLKKFVTGDSLPLILFDESTSSFGFSFFSKESRLINTGDLNFTQIPSSNPSQLIYRLKTGDDTWMDFIYTLKKNDYRLSFDLKGNNLANMMLPNTNALDFNWGLKLREQEKGRKFEERYSGVNYKFLVDDVEKLSENKDASKNVDEALKWVSFKDQFFACIAIANKGFNSNVLASKLEKDGSPYIKSYSMSSSIDFNLRSNQTTGMNFYFGPIKYALLRSYDKGVPSNEKLMLNRIVPLGGKLIRWANTGIIIPMFNLFGRFISNYGLIILLMTFVIKLLLFPFTYKSYMSSAKMKVLQPQIAEINTKYAGNDKAAARSQATMELYQRCGVNPMGGCLPMLLQMPILFAMYSFFPSSIELRQQSFLWASDLSTYDAIVSWSGNIPFVTRFFGNHISLFCLLMTLTNLLYTHLNMQTQPSNNQMPGMKAMMYMMPVMFLFMFNQYSAGLSFYFFISTLISIIQTYSIRAFVNDEKLLAKLNDNKKKPVKKKGFAARLEQMQKDQQKMLKEQQKNKRR